MKLIHRTYNDTEVVELGVNVACPACKREWMEYGDKPIAARHTYWNAIQTTEVAEKSLKCTLMHHNQRIYSA